MLRISLVQQVRRGQQVIADLADGVFLRAPSEVTSLDDFLASYAIKQPGQ